MEGVNLYFDIFFLCSGHTGWDYVGALTGYKTTKKQLKVKLSRQTRVCLGFYPAKTGTMSSGPMARLVGLFYFTLLQ